MSVATEISGIWISKGKVISLPTDGKAWDSVYNESRVVPKPPALNNQDQRTNVTCLAKALVAVRLDDKNLAREVQDIVMSCMYTEGGGRTLALGRELAAYVISADLVGLSLSQEREFFMFLFKVRDRVLDGRTLRTTHETRPNNWGTMCGASRVAVAAYLGDAKDISDAARVFKGYLGDRSSWSAFEYGDDSSWQADPSNPSGVNPKGSVIDGVFVDGSLPEEMRRGGSFSNPPKLTGYPWEAMQGILVMASILSRFGYIDVWNWCDSAIYRAAFYLYLMGSNWYPSGDDEWQPWLLNYYYSDSFRYSSFPFVLTEGARPGKNMGWTDWTHRLSS